MCWWVNCDKKCAFIFIIFNMTTNKIHSFHKCFKNWPTTILMYLNIWFEVEGGVHNFLNFNIYASFHIFSSRLFNFLGEAATFCLNLQVKTVTRTTMRRRIIMQNLMIMRQPATTMRLTMGKNRKIMQQVKSWFENMFLP